MKLNKLFGFKPVDHRLGDYPGQLSKRKEKQIILYNRKTGLIGVYIGHYKPCIPFGSKDNKKVSFIHVDWINSYTNLFLTKKEMIESFDVHLPSDSLITDQDILV